MRELFLKLAIMLCIVISIFVLIWILPGSYTHDIAALYNKKQMLLSKNPPRAIFIGGSSLLTLDSHRIEKNTGRTVVNMGIWGGISTRVMLEEIKPYLKKGDAVIITLEYAKVLDPIYMKFIRENDISKRYFFLMSPSRQASIYLNNHEYFNLLKIIARLCQTKTKAFIENLITFKFKHMKRNGYIHYKEEFNRYGDRNKPFKIVRPLDDTGKRYEPPLLKWHHYLIDFHEYAQNKGIIILFYYSHLPEKEFRINESHIKEMDKELKKLITFPIMNKPIDYMFPRKYFADTIYHLNRDGEKVRTDKMIKMLKYYLK